MVKFRHCVAVFFIVLFCACVISFVIYTKTCAPVAPKTLAELLALPESDLKRVDIARINLLLATGLPNAEHLDVEQTIATIDNWSELIKKAEKKYLPTFYRNPAKYDYSLSKFKAITLVLTMKEDLKCGYNMELVRSGIMSDYASTRFYNDSRDIFIHGFTNRRQGTCSSIPVLVVALARRCGYPMYLVSSNGHLFCRWTDNKESFNVEASIRGTDTFPDSYYLTFPKPFSEKERENEGYMKNLSPIEELSVFAGLRAMCFLEHGMLPRSMESFSIALRGFPKSEVIRNDMATIKRRMRHE